MHKYIDSVCFTSLKFKFDVADILCYKNSEKRENPDKAKPSERRGREAAGFNNKMAELPKDVPIVQGDGRKRS